MVGVLKIVRFNWPWYLGAAAITAAGVILITSGILRGAAVAVAATFTLLADFWLLASLAVSYYVYDRSAFARGEWLNGAALSAGCRAAVFHAGLNEAAVATARFLPASSVRVFDFYEPERNGTRSLKRARAQAGQKAEAISPGRIPVDNGVLDICLVVFAAHEIRRDKERATFFAELARTLAAGGRVYVVEHLRDAWNLLVYGPGAFHFLSRATWIRSFAGGGLAVLQERSCTPFVRVFELGKPS